MPLLLRANPPPITFGMIARPAKGSTRARIALVHRAPILVILALGSSLIAVTAGAETDRRNRIADASTGEAWLELKGDQRRYRERIEALPPRDDAQLRHLELRQREALRGLERQPRPPRHSPAPAEPAKALGRELRQRRRLDAQRLEGRIERQYQNYHRR